MGSLDSLSDLFSAFNIGNPFGARDGASGAKKPLATSAVTLISHTHGRDRREQRGIERRELQEAVKYGRKERANPGRDGQARWRYTHKGVVYITDDSSRHEITSWRLDDALDAPPAAVGPAGGGTAHVIVVVDHSGSMRKDDVPGYGSRTAAVYDCLARDLVEPQLKVLGGSRMEISLIEMQDEAEVVLCRSGATADLLSYLKRRSSTAYARSHGNYLPALDEALGLMREDAAEQKQLFLTRAAAGPFTGGGWAAGKPSLVNCPYSESGTSGCRALVRKSVNEKCLARIRNMGDLLGRDRVSVNTVAFGPAAEDFAVLQAMSKVLPRGSFQKLGLSAQCLKTAFTSLTSSLATLRTEAVGGGGAGLTLRTDLRAKGQRQEYEEHHRITNGVTFDVYVGKKFIFKRQYDRHAGELVDVPLAAAHQLRAYQEQHPHAEIQLGVAHGRNWFSEGAERVVFQCTEVVSVDGGATAHAIGPRLVAKQSRHEEQVFEPKFHRTFCRTQGEAAELAALFNRRLARGPAWQVHFLPCYVYKIIDGYYAYSKGGQLEILVEQELEGRFTKWNNNAGGVSQGRSGLASSVRNNTAPQQARPANNATALGAIAEDDEVEDGDGEERDNDDDDGEEEEDVNNGGSIDGVPQAFSHFTWDCTGGQKLVCDLQGVWNSTDGFTLTDPVIHHALGGHRNGATDKGQAGIHAFFATHTCNALCRQLGLRSGPVR
ncbi:hypothetical protein CHLRE_03g156650v5 [Chlamydomonas reinhardtii]|uniref:Alpha-type protein kinase domain-containing protein n=1 Tax=Chlamydomonas reinhardtii TaxID=3055 RepID=A0A2K3DW26_CHLRE|nr:uncharacterized protein CHLRE_03g156650v5 [Chlamydomonas reinhardtii]PNW84737.1 hypothetical protein CHLRE_03g156650v5 [Chlamydomonas reinhardtii]